jgi:predicted transcriptional regulator
MAMGLVSDEELERELKVNGNHGVVTVKDRSGRKEGDNNVPDSLRKVIAQDAIENGRNSALALARSVGVSDSSVSAYTNGSTSTASYNERNKELVEHTNKVKEQIAGKARTRLLQSLRAITPEKLQNAKLKDVSAVARDMSAIVKNMEPRDVDEAEGRGPKVNINIFAPARRKEEEYDTLVVNE